MSSTTSSHIPTIVQLPTTPRPPSPPSSFLLGPSSIHATLHLPWFLPRWTQICRSASINCSNMLLRMVLHFMININSRRRNILSPFIPSLSQITSPSLGHLRGCLDRLLLMLWLRFIMLSTISQGPRSQLRVLRLGLCRGHLLHLR